MADQTNSSPNGGSNLPPAPPPVVVTPPGKSLPAPSSATNVGTGRPKKPLQPGRSLMDWIRLANSGEPMTSLRGQLRGVTPAELAKHNTEKDCWMAIHEQVYDVTRYLEFHPGGADELMRGAGQDATELFNEVHRWVNYSSMLSRCLVGPLVAPRSAMRRRRHTDFNISPTHAAADKSAPMPPPFVRPIPLPTERPRWDWKETDESITLILTYPDTVPHSHYATFSITDRRIKLFITVPPHLHNFYFDMHSGLQWHENQLPVAKDKECRLVLHKIEPGSKVPTIGQVIRDDWKLIKNAPLGFHKVRVVAREQVTHDTLLFRLEWPEGFHLRVPVGHHVRVRVTIEGPEEGPGMELARSYTPVASSLADSDLTPEEIGGRQFYLMVKIYPDGCLTPHLAKHEPDSILSVSSPDGTFAPTMIGWRKCRYLLLLAAGTGLTPMVRLIRAVLHSDDIPMEEPLVALRFFFFNKQERDIAWRDQLEALKERFPDRVSLVYILSKADDTWTGPRGRVSCKLLQEHTPEAQTTEKRERIFSCICGPDGFTEDCVEYLKTGLQLTDSQIHAFKG